MNDKEFDRAFDEQQAKSNTVQQAINEKIQKMEMDLQQFEVLSMLDAKMLGKVYNNDGNLSIKTIMTVCIVLRTDMKETKRLLKLGGLYFKPKNRTHFAYQQLIVQGYSDIVECNAKLEEWGIAKYNHLGSGSYKKP